MTTITMREPRLEERLLAALLSRAMSRAGSALAEMAGQVVTVDTPLVGRLTADEVMNLVGGPGSPIVAVYLGMIGGITGHCLVLLPPAGAHRLANILINGDAGEAPEDVLSFDEMEISALQELGNVTIGAFMNEIGMHLHEPVHPTVPQAVIEMCGAILDGVLMDLASTGEEILAARTVFAENGRVVDGTFLILPRQASLDTLLKSVGAAA
jgi:chemotaxis protein CheC